MAATCYFGDQSGGTLIVKTFMQIMKNLSAQKLSSEPKENPKDALRFAIAFDGRIIR